MNNLGLLAIVKAKNGREDDTKNFLSNTVEAAKKEDETLNWYSFQIDESTFGVFDTFENEYRREAHLNGEIAKALMENASELFTENPKIRKIEIISSN